MAEKILVIEDESNIADFLRRGLVASGFEVTAAGDGASGLERFRACTPDLIVLDLILPDIDGIDVCREIRSESDVGILILTARDLVGERVRGLDAGADDYISKPFAFEELLARVRSTLRRCAADASGLIQVDDLEVDVERRIVTRSGRRVHLTTREFELLHLLAQSAGKPVSRDYIVQRVWGYDADNESDPAKVYIAYLRRKLNGEDLPDLIETIRGFGYMLKAPEE